MFRGVLIAFGLINFAFGLLAFIDPVVVTTWSGLGLEGPAAFGEVRAVFGGVFSTVGLLYLIAIAVSNPKPILGTLALLFAGLSVGRISSLTIDGWSLYTAVGLFLELAIALVTAYIWLNPAVLRDADQPASTSPGPASPVPKAPTVPAAPAEPESQAELEAQAEPEVPSEPEAPSEPDKT